MTAKELATLLDGREYGNEISKAEGNLAAEAGLVVIFGASDDLCELRGAIDDEIDRYEGGLLRFCNPQLNKKIEAAWCNKERNCSWSYRTDLPHEEFNIYEDGELYCIGIVLDLNALKSSVPVKYCDTALAMEKLCEAFEGESEIQEIIVRVLDELPAADVRENYAASLTMEDFLPL